MSKIKEGSGIWHNDALMTKDLLSLALRNVPRYTSYPTAPHFHNGVTADTYAGWLGGLTKTDSLSLYLHVPFCRELCHYCGCHTKATRQDAPLKAYGATLAREIRLTRRFIGRPGPVKHIHWGGGTPSLLPRESLMELNALLRVLFDFAPDLEHAIELDPRFVTGDLAATLAQIGINRASLGVQDFDPDVQNAIGRVQPYSLVAKAAEHLRTAGIESLNFDLMYGLPGQTPTTVLETVEKTLSLAPGRIALFGYAHVPWMHKHQRLIDETALPSAEERLEMAGIARAALTKAGYVAVGLDHYARKDDSMACALSDGSLKRNFQGYTTDQGEQLIGFGVSSIGKLSAGYVQTLTDVGSWRRKIEAGALPVGKGLELTAQDRVRGRIIEELMTDYACDLGSVCREHGASAIDLTDAFETLAALAEDGLVRLEWGRDEPVRVRITETGRPFVRLAAAAFDSYLATGQKPDNARHSAAV